MEDGFNWVVRLYGKVLSMVLRHSFVTLLVLLTTIGLNVYLFIRVPKGFFPQQDTGRMNGQIIADQDTSFQSMDKTLLQMVNIVAADPAVDTVNGFTGGGGGGGGASTMNQGRMFVSLKPLEERKITVDYIMQRLRPKLARIPGATLYLQAVAGPSRGRAQQRRALSVHHAGRQPAGSDRVRTRACSSS